MYIYMCIKSACLYSCVCVLAFTQPSRLESSHSSYDPVSPFLINSTLSSLPNCRCCVSEPPLSLIASSRLNTPALCHAAAAFPCSQEWSAPLFQTQPKWCAFWSYLHSFPKNFSELWCINVYIRNECFAVLNLCNKFKFQQFKQTIALYEIYAQKITKLCVWSLITPFSS